MESARYRADDAGEDAPANWALEALYKLHDIARCTQSDDPLRDAAHVAIHALMSALHVSPVLRIDRPRTILEANLPHGPDALAHVANRGPAFRERLDKLRAVTFGEAPGPIPHRRALVAAVINAGRDVLDELKSREEYAVALEVLLSARDVTDEVRELPYFWTSAAAVNNAHFSRTREMLFAFVEIMRAMVAVAQHAHRGGGAGAPPRGALNHLTEIAAVLRVAGLECSSKALRDDCRDAYAARDRHLKRGGRRPFAPAIEAPATAPTKAERPRTRPRALKPATKPRRRSPSTRK